MNWGGMAFDPERQILVTPTNRIAAVVTLTPRQDARKDAKSIGNAGVSPASTASTADSGTRLEAEVAQQRGTPYILKREYLLKAGDKGPVPYTPPPWGTLAAVNLQSGTLAWEVLRSALRVMGSPGAFSGVASF